MIEERTSGENFKDNLIERINALMYRWKEEDSKIMMEANNEIIRTMTIMNIELTTDMMNKLNFVNEEMLKQSDKTKLIETICESQEKIIKLTNQILEKIIEQKTRLPESLIEVINLNANSLGSIYTIIETIIDENTTKWMETFEEWKIYCIEK
jgi:hypothetical protein